MMHEITWSYDGREPYFEIFATPARDRAHDRFISQTDALESLIAEIEEKGISIEIDGEDFWVPVRVVMEAIKPTAN